MRCRSLGSKGEQPWIEVPAGEDPLVTADRNGRPIAILRIGSRDTKRRRAVGCCFCNAADGGV